MVVGRVWQDAVDADFSRSSGLDSSASDWLVSGHFAHPLGVTLSARGLLDNSARFSKAEARADWTSERLDLGESYLLLVTDPAEDRSKAQSEWTFDGSYRMTRHWTASTEWRYDLADRRLDRVGLGLQYRNECVQVDFGATRSYARSANIEPFTDFDLTVALKGFSTGGSAKEYRRSCN
jgi:LPS-assembly protein